MKGVYICTGQDLENLSSGITKKILKQIELMNNISDEIKIINFNNKRRGCLDKFKFLLPGVISLYEKEMITFNEEKIEWKEIAFVYIRKITFCKGFIEMLKQIKIENPKIIILMEIPTFPINGEYMGIKKLLIPINVFYSHSIKKYVDYIVTYSRDDYIWGVKTLKICNSVDFQEIHKKKQTQLKSITMIAVASFVVWHGYDRVIEGLREYYKNETKREVNLIFVGMGKEIQKYKHLTKKYKLEKYIRFVGTKSGKELDNIYDVCNLALDAMGRHRSKVFYNSSLKGKEYGAKGLPIVSGVETELDIDKDFKYYCRVPADDSNIDIKRIVEFWEGIYEEEQEKVIDNIREYNYSRFHFKRAFKPVLDVLIERKNIED